MDANRSVSYVNLALLQQRNNDPIGAEQNLKKALALEKGSGEPNKTKVGVLTRDKLRAIAEQKMPDLTAHDVEAAMKIIAGTARSMGVTVEC